MYSIIPTLTENAIEFDMKKRVCGGGVVVVFLPFSLKTEKESSFCVERSSRFEQKTQKKKNSLHFPKKSSHRLKKN